MICIRRKHARKHALFYICILVIVLISIFIFCRTEKMMMSLSESEVDIRISLDKTTSIEGERIYITVKITNLGTMRIYGEGYYYTLYLLYPNGTWEELFYAFNTSMGIIEPGESYEEMKRAGLFLYSNDIKTWKHIGNLPAGRYFIFAVYGSRSNPFYDESKMPYDETVSNVVMFTVVTKSRSFG